jgi:rSAM/selenodomain-associated transferase 1
MASAPVLAHSIIAVFARRPETGKVKTRLSKALGNEDATSLYKSMLSDTLQAAQTAAELVGGSVVVGFTPEDAFEGTDSLAAFWNGARLPQRDGDLGERMCGCIEDLIDAGARQVLLIGSDAPDLPVAILKQMLQTLIDSNERQLCLGPAHDGGFYAIGANAPLPPNCFHGVIWSTSSTLQQVSERARQCGWPVNTRFPVWRDVDEMDDLVALSRRLRLNCATESTAALHTRAWLNAHW